MLTFVLASSSVQYINWLNTKKIARPRPLTSTFSVCAGVTSELLPPPNRVHQVVNMLVVDGHGLEAEGYAKLAGGGKASG